METCGSISWTPSFRAPLKMWLNAIAQKKDPNSRDFCQYDLLDKTGENLIGVYEAAMRTLIVQNDPAINQNVYVLYSNIVTSYKRDDNGRVVGTFTPVDIFQLNNANDNIGHQIIQLKSDFYYKFHDINAITFWLQTMNGTEPINLNLTLHFSFRKSC